jgi:hypothetical protein
MAEYEAKLAATRGEVFEKSANSRLEISGSGAIFAHLVLCNIAVAMANPTGDRMVRFLRFHGSRTELEGLIMDFKTFQSAGYSKLKRQTSSSSLASLGKVADGDAASAAHEARLQAGYEAGHAEGYEDGYAHGYEAGREAGHKLGYKKGYDEGFQIGLGAKTPPEPPPLEPQPEPPPAKSES